MSAVSDTATVDAAAPNQSRPFVDRDLFAIDLPLRAALADLVPRLDTAALHALGRDCGSAAMQRHARLANVHPPLLHTHDGQGSRIDEVEFHPSYHVLLGHALQHGLHGAPWAEGGAGAHLARAAGFVLSTQLEPSVLCPVSMTYAAAPALRGGEAAPAIATWRSGSAARGYDARALPAAAKTALTLGMGMTERQGGSDVRANTTAARPDGRDEHGERYRLRGHKWFFSAPMCDGFLVLAQADGGLTCFLLPHWLPDGTRNALRLQRLKAKLGNHANASSEVEFDDALAWRLGDEGRGIAQILAMGTLTRLDCALGTAALMRQALNRALHHTAQRRAFGRALLAQPLMRNVLADLALESEAATLLALRLAAAVDRSEDRAAAPAVAAREAALRRVLTPVAKFWICKRGAGFAQEAMECLGGNGYVEARGGDGGDGLLARIYREMPLNSIWEGAGNVMALDLLRGWRDGGVREALAHETDAVRGLHAAYDRHHARVLARLDDAPDALVARAAARDLALLLQAALLARQSTTAAFAAFCDTRLSAGSDCYGRLDAGHDLDAILQRAMPWEP